MKQIFNIILTLIFLVSGIGFGSAHHHCLYMQKQMVVNDDGCCADDLFVRTAINSQSPENKDDHACCASTGTNLPVGEKETYLSENCCKVHHIYNQTDSSLLPQISDVSPATDTGNELIFVPQHLQIKDRFVPTISADPFTYVNLPLLN